MFKFGYGNKIDPSYWTFKEFTIFFLWVVIFYHLGPIWACFRLFLGPTTLENPPLDQNYSDYVQVWVGEQNRSFILDFGRICNCFPVGGHFLSFVAYMGLF